MITAKIKFMNSFNKRLDTGDCGVTCWTELLLKERKTVFFLSSPPNLGLGARKRNWHYFSSLPTLGLYCCKLAYLNICKMKVRLYSWDWLCRTGVGVWLEEFSLYFNGHYKGFPREFFRWKLFFYGRLRRVSLLLWLLLHSTYVTAGLSAVLQHNKNK